MKKRILTAFIFLNLLSALFLAAKAEVLPYYINSLRRYGIGYTSVKSPLILRQTPDGEGKILETLNFDYLGKASCQINSNRCELDEIFAAYSEKNKVALLTTLDETEGWSLVCFNQSEAPICGWADEKENKFYNWMDFFSVYGKKYGLYLYRDLKKPDKLLYAAPMKQTNTTGSIEMPKAITPWLVRGNWVLVKVHDFNNQMKTGWFNFRGDDGKLKLFVKF